MKLLRISWNLIAKTSFLATLYFIGEFNIEFKRNNSVNLNYFYMDVLHMLLRIQKLFYILNLPITYTTKTHWRVYIWNASLNNNYHFPLRANVTSQNWNCQENTFFYRKLLEFNFSLFFCFNLKIEVCFIGH